MLEIPNHPSNNMALNYDKLAAAYLPANYFPIIPLGQQQVVLNQLEKEISNERFYFLVDVKENKITDCKGMELWLGYTDAHFSIKNYLEIIHPAHAFIQSYYGSALFATLMYATMPLQFMQPTIKTLMALKHQNGNYLYCKRECFPFQLSADNKMTAYLCSFNILKGYINENYHVRLFSVDDKHVGNWLQILKMTNKIFEANKVFSFQETRILKRYSLNKNTNSDAISKAFKIKKTTVGTYNKRIIKKLETLTGQRFGNAKKIGEYLNAVGLI